jgi:hypothetical protein
VASSRGCEADSPSERNARHVTVARIHRNSWDGLSIPRPSKRFMLCAHHRPHPTMRFLDSHRQSSAVLRARSPPAEFIRYFNAAYPRGVQVRYRALSVAVL